MHAYNLSARTEGGDRTVVAACWLKVFSESPCFKAIRQRMTEQDTGHPSLAPAQTYTDTHNSLKHQAAIGLYNRKQEALEMGAVAWRL